MVIKIHQTVSTEKAFYYNEKKVELKEVTCYHAANTLAQNPFVYSSSRRLKELLDIEKLNCRVKNKCLHISLNPSLDDVEMMSGKMIKEEIQNMMEHLGYGKQPYYVYKHQDLDRVHFHIVTTRIDRYTGKKIADNNERRRLQTFIKELELKYQLDHKVEQEKPDFYFSPKSRNIKHSLESLFHHLNGLIEIQSKEMYEKALKLFHVEIRKSGRGHIVVVVDDNGNPIRYPIRLSKFKETPVFWMKEKLQLDLWEKNKKASSFKSRPLLADFLLELEKHIRYQELKNERSKGFTFKRKNKNRRL